MSLGVLSSWQEAGPPGWRRLATTNIGVVCREGGQNGQANWEAKVRKVRVDSKSACGSKQTTGGEIGGAKESVENDHKGIANERHYVPENYFMQPVNIIDLLIKRWNYNFKNECVHR